MSRKELVQLVRNLLNVEPSSTDKELEYSMGLFAESIHHPGGTDLIYYPEQWGLPPNASAESIVDEALSWRPRIVACLVSYVFPHPKQTSLFCLGVEIPGKISTQVVSRHQLKIGDVCIAALSGVKLPDGRIVKHGFMNSVFSAGEILGVTDEAVGTELPLASCPGYSFTIL